MLSYEGQKPSAPANLNWIPIEKIGAPEYQQTTVPTISPATKKYHDLTLRATEPSESMVNYQDQRPSAPPDWHWIPIDKTDKRKISADNSAINISPTPTELQLN
jgi:hypothetical protein